MGTKERIVAEGLRLFNERGLGRVGVRDIANHLKISPGNLSYHFHKKEDLIIFILKEMMARNTVAFTRYLSIAEPSLCDYMFLVRQLFLNNYRYRGVTQEFIEASRVFEKEKFVYKDVEKVRMKLYTDIHSGLVRTKELVLKREDILFLNSFMSLYGRVWIAEAFISFKGRPKREIINYYLLFGCKQYLLFASEKGSRSIQRFCRKGLL